MNALNTQNDVSLQRNSLIQLLKSLSKQELKEFDKFIRSPFFNNRKEVLHFFQTLREFYPLFNQRKLTKSHIFSSLRPNEVYKDVVIRKLVSDLSSLIEKYLSYKEFNLDILQPKLKFIESLLKRNVGKIPDKEIKKCDEIRKSNKILDDMGLLNNFHLDSVKYANYLYSGKIALANNMLSDLGDSLTYFFLNRLFIFLSDSAVVEIDFNKEIESELIGVFLSSLNVTRLIDGIKKLTDDKKILLLYGYYSYRAYQCKEDEEPELMLEEILNKYADKSSRQLNRSLHSVLYNVYNIKRQLGREKYNRKAFQILKKLTERNLLISSGGPFIEAWLFLQITRYAFVNREFEWAQSFIEGNVDKLNPDEKNDIYYYSKALIAHGMREFDKALSLIMKVKLAYAKHYIKELLVKIYYDLDYIEQLLSFMDSYSHFLKSEKTVSKNTRTDQSKYLSYINRLIKIKGKDNFKALPSLKKNIIKETPSVNNRWLLEKVEELELAMGKQTT